MNVKAGDIVVVELAGLGDFRNEPFTAEVMFIKDSRRHPGRPIVVHALDDGSDIRVSRREIKQRMK